MICVKAMRRFRRFYNNFDEAQTISKINDICLLDTKDEEECQTTSLRE
jgi:hypothetical protein